MSASHALRQGEVILGWDSEAGLTLSLRPFALSLGLSTDKGACRAWDQQPGWLCMRHPDLWLMKCNFLRACVLVNIKQLVAAMCNLGSALSPCGRTQRQSWEKPRTLQTTLPSRDSARLERVSRYRGKVVVSCALWGRLVYNTGNRKCQIQYRAFHKLSFSQPTHRGGL